MSKYAVFFDDAGRLKRVDPLRYDSSSNAFQFYNSDRSHYFAIKANDAATTDITHTWPAAPVNGAFLRTNSSGNLAWAFNFITKTDFDFVVGAGGQATFETGTVLSGKYVAVYVNGVLKREGVGNDYRAAWPGGTQVQFSYTLPENAWVRIVVDDGAIPNEQERIETGGNSTWYPSPSLGDLRDKYVQVYRNGQLLRQGINFDYYIEQTAGQFLIFPNPAPAGAWMKLVVY